MSIQSALTALAGAFISFYLICVAVGRADIPWKMIGEFRHRALVETTSSWGCPSVFHKDACHSYDPARYRRVELRTVRSAAVAKLYSPNRTIDVEFAFRHGRADPDITSMFRDLVRTFQSARGHYCHVLFWNRIYFCHEISFVLCSHTIVRYSKQMI